MHKHKVVVGHDGPYKNPTWWSNPRNRIIAIIVAVAVVLLAGSLMLWHHMSVRSQQTIKVNAAISASVAAYNRRDYVNAVNVLSGMAVLATSGTQKASVYQGQAQASSAQNKLTEALQYYNLKHKADASTVNADAYTVGGIYERLGQKDKAIEQYKIALAYARTQNNQYGSDIDAIQANIDELEQSK